MKTGETPVLLSKLELDSRQPLLNLTDDASLIGFVLGDERH